MGEITGKRTVYETPWFQLESKEVDGDDEAPFYALNLSDYVGVFAIHSDDRILLVKQYRPAVERETLEFVAGHVEHGETPKEAAMRELREETGYRAATWTALGSSWPDTGRLGNRHWGFLAQDLEPLDNYSPEEGVEPLSLSPSAFLEAIQNGQFAPSLHLGLVTAAMARGLWKLPN
jgi:ADP-ribose pyrophosphatase